MFSEGGQWDVIYAINERRIIQRGMSPFFVTICKYIGPDMHPRGKKQCGIITTTIQI